MKPVAAKFAELLRRKVEHRVSPAAAPGAMVVERGVTLASGDWVSFGRWRVP